VGVRNFNLSCKHQNSVKTAILMLNMGGPQRSADVEQYLTRIMTDTDMMQLPVQRLASNFLDPPFSLQSGLGMKFFTPTTRSVQKVMRI